jgi:hypothetical protein
MGSNEFKIKCEVQNATSTKSMVRYVFPLNPCQGKSTLGCHNFDRLEFFFKVPFYYNWKLA